MENQPNGDYLDRLMRRQSFSALWPLFAKATKPAKELTESASALQYLRPFVSQYEEARVIHIGDGAHARTAALFALKTRAENISVDPVINEKLVKDWRDQYQIRRFSWLKGKIAEHALTLNTLPRVPTLLTFVHAHVNVDKTLDSLHWDVAYTLACCVPGKQLTKDFEPQQEGLDQSVLSQDRHYQVLVNPQSKFFASAPPSPRADTSGGS